MDDPLAASLDALLQSAVAEGGVPGVIASVVDADDVLYTGKAGIMDAEGEAPMVANAIFRLFSKTKPLISLGTLLLQEDGLLTLQDPADRYLPELQDREVPLAIDGTTGAITTRPSSTPITIGPLLTHRADFAYGFST